MEKHNSKSVEIFVGNVNEGMVGGGFGGGFGHGRGQVMTFVDTSTTTPKINLKNMKNQNKKVINQNYYKKNKLIISERNKQNRKRQKLIDKFHFYGFWLLLTIYLILTKF